METRTLLNELHKAYFTKENCIDSGHNAANSWEAYFDKLTDLLPSGGGFDAGTTFDEVKSTKDKRIVLNTSFHHMTDDGFYNGWTEHSVILTPCFDGFNIRVSGKNKNEVKDYIADVFYSLLSDDFCSEIAFELLK